MFAGCRAEKAEIGIVILQDKCRAGMGSDIRSDQNQLGDEILDDYRKYYLLYT